ncbi:MAG: hypothetical protein KIT33_04455 [Candidatus Kapabacteria bacterium]|nr:hypothetical protein [Ignavibacteriota bacterium]MCW5884208.1 hypothetical protein [Candidatus Kapabacteria bacterium]
MTEDQTNKGYVYYNKIIPMGCYPFWTVSEDDYRQIMLGEYRNYNPYSFLYFQPILNSDPDFMKGNIGKLENVDWKGFSNENGIVPTTPFLLETYPNNWTFFKDHIAQKDVYFTFDHISLWKLVDVQQSKPLEIHLRKVDRKRIVKKNSVFMIMPFHYPALDSLYSSIKDLLKTEMQINLKRADEFLENDIVIETVYREIELSEFLIADTTFDNKNVFYEIGYASALNKEIISIQDFCIAKSVYFDRAHIRHLNYHLNELEKFYSDLKNTIIAIRSKI